MASGYIEHTHGTGTTLTDAWTSFTLTTSTAAGQLAIPTSGARWNSLEISIERASGTMDTANISVMITWDSAGVYPIHGPSQSTYNLDFKTATNKKAAIGIDLDLVPTFPSANATNGTVYVWLKGNATATSPDDKVKLVRIHWNELSKG